MGAKESPDQYDLFLERIALDDLEEKKEKGVFLFVFQDVLVFQIFSDWKTNLVNNSVRAVSNWDQWSAESQKAILRCADSGLLEVQHTKPTEKGFQLWLAARRRVVNTLLPSFDQLREEYFEKIPKIPILSLTQKGIDHLRNIRLGSV